MKQITIMTLIAVLFATSLLFTGCATGKQDAILKQVNAISGATKKR